VSTILKALQRVEDERPSGAGSVPRRAVRGDFVAEGARGLMRKRRRPGPRPVFWSSVGAVVLLAGLVWWRLPEREAEVVEASEARSEGNARAESSGRPGPRAQQAGTAESPTSPPAQGTARKAEAPSAPTEAAPPPVAAAAPEPELPAAPALPAEVAERLPPLGVTLDAASPEVVAKAPAEPAPVAAAPEPPPVAVEPPAPAPVPPAAAPKPAVAKVAPQRPPPAPVAKPAPPPPSAPAVLVERTSWHPSVERRVAWVSVEGLAGARELHEGDAVGALVVKEIRPSSVIFLHGADTIQRRVGEKN